MSLPLAFDNPGNLLSEPGSESWAVAVRLDLLSTLNDIHGDAEHLKVMVALVREHKGYLKLRDRKGNLFSNYEAFCFEPQPFGLGDDPRNIDVIIQEREERQSPKAMAEKTEPAPGTEQTRKARAEGGKQGGRGNKKKPTLSDKGGLWGTGADYLTAKIARDFPEILDRMKAGEFKSVRQAALAAGILKPSITLPIDPARAARLLIRHFKPDALAELMREVERLTS